MKGAAEMKAGIIQALKESSFESDWCLALHGNHDEHQCHKKPGHQKGALAGFSRHECYCGVRW